MNRSILIVICDFIVSSMLALSTGLMTSDNPAGGAQSVDAQTMNTIVVELRSEQARMEAARAELRRELVAAADNASAREKLAELEKQLAALQVKSEMLEKQAKLTPETTGALTPEALQKQLEKEIERRAYLRLQHDSLQYEHEHMRKQQQETGGRLIASREELASTREQLSATGKSLESAQAKLAETQRDVSQKSEALTRTQTELEQLGKNLAQTGKELAQEKEESKKTAGRLQQQLSKTEGEVSFFRGRTSAAERELAEAQSRYERAQRLANTREVELGETQKQLDNLRNVLKTAVSDLSRTKSDLEASRQRENAGASELAELQGRTSAAEQKFNSAKKLLDEAEAKLKNVVLESYSEAVVSLDVAVHERRLLVDLRQERQLFLPLVTIDGRTVLAGATLALLGDAEKKMEFNRVTLLRYLCGVPDENAKTPAKALPGPLLLARNDRRVAFLSVPAMGRKPLRALNWEELKQRGIQDLFLFKSSSFGKESAELTGRCSVNFSAGDEYMYIRNSARSGGTELRAEPGDFVMTRQGELVGVVVSQESFEMGRRQEARCVILPGKVDWNALETIPFGAPDPAGFFTEFGARARAVTGEIERNERAGR